MRKIYIRAGVSPLEPVPVGEAIARDVFGTNTGNLIYQYSVFRTLMCADTAIDARFIGPVVNAPGGVERLNGECVCAVIPLANAFRVGFNLKPLTDMIRRLKIPCVILGCGLQTDDPESIREGFPFDGDVREFMDAALDKSALVGLRGEFTAEYLKRLGYVPERHFTVIGCPSMFLNGPVMPEPALPPITAETRFSINTRVTQSPALNRLISQTERRYPGYHLVLQMRRELEMLAWGARNNTSSPARDATGFYPFGWGHPDVRGGRAIGFTEARSWLEYMRDIDYSFGSRIHGNLSAVISGTPAFVFTSDTRTEELCRYGNVAHMPIGQLKEGADIRDILQGADLKGVCRGHRQRFDHFVDFLNKNGLEHIYRDGPNPARVPFDEAMMRVPAGGRVERGCIPPAQAAGLWLKCYAERIRRRLK